MATIARNHARRIQAVTEATVYVRLYHHGSWTEERTEDVTALIEEWKKSPRARLTEDEPGKKWSLHFHGNRFAYLYAYDYAEHKAQQDREREATAEGAAGETGAGCWCGATPCPTPAEHEAFAPVAELCEAIDLGTGSGQGAGPFPPGFDAQTRSASEAITARHRAAGLLGRDPLGRNMGSIARTVVAKTVKAKRLQGWSHDQIREHFEKERGAAQERGDVGRVAACDTFLSVHAGMVADLARLATAADSADQARPEPVGQEPERAALPVGPPRSPDLHPEPAGRTAPAPAMPPAAAVEPAPVKLPTVEEGYKPYAQAPAYAVRHAHDALSDYPARGVGVEFPVMVSGVQGADDTWVSVQVWHFRGKGAQPAKGPARDRWEKYRAQVLITMVDAGFENIRLTNVGFRAQKARPRGAATIVHVGTAEYGDLYIDRPVSFPQYPELTGWMMRCRWGHGYTGPMTPWIEHVSGEQVGMESKTEKQAAEALAAYYGLVSPVRVAR